MHEGVFAQGSTMLISDNRFKGTYMVDIDAGNAFGVCTITGNTIDVSRQPDAVHAPNMSVYAHAGITA